MVIRRRQAGAFSLLELLVALGIFGMAVGGFAVTSWYDTRMLGQQYVRAAAMEIVDGEMEVLAAGEWKAYAEGSQAYEVSAGAAESLPPGTFTLTIEDRTARLEWRPDNPKTGVRVAREVTIR
ncbi:MAG: prepilin-type N-terminal cleavage/methylation domain-containing protein [bacterium]